VADGKDITNGADGAQAEPRFSGGSNETDRRGKRVILLLIVSIGLLLVAMTARGGSKRADYSPEKNWPRIYTPRQVCNCWVQGQLEI
jgi:hypothetical protein